MNTKRIHTKAICGPAGIQCNCCRAAKSVKAARTLHNRIIRRKANADLRNYKGEE